MENKITFKPSRGKETFVLVHGAWHGGWCWERVENLLHQLGHITIAPDLPAHGNDPANLLDQSLETYVNRVVDVLDAQPEPVILVGHSMGGLVITLAAEKRPEKIKKLIYLAAMLPKDGQSAHGHDENAIRPGVMDALSADGIVAHCGFEAMAGILAQRCSYNDQLYSFSKLTQDELVEPFLVNIHTTAENWGSVRRFYITATNDLAVPSDMVNDMLNNCPCEDVYCLEGDHNMFYSTPVELAYVLNEIALKA